MKLIYLLSIIAVAKAASELHIQRACGNRRYRPRCGADGRTYANNCEMRHNNVELAYYGECSPCEKCKGEIEKVCGTDGKDFKEFLNSCWATCNHHYVVDPEECKKKDDNSVCGEYIHRVCGVDGMTYRNPCVAKKQEVQIEHYGKCGEDCVRCEPNLYQMNDPFFVQPVCGIDRKWYKNACYLNCFKTRQAENTDYCFGAFHKDLY